MAALRVRAAAMAGRGYRSHVLENETNRAPGVIPKPCVIVNALWADLVPVILRLVGPLDRDADVLGLHLGQLCQRRTKLIQVQPVPWAARGRLVDSSQALAIGPTGQSPGSRTSWT